ncbi:hypothetical protein BU23DRAFT_598366 [Bimuria novae-zelandiae CBS 107.79]|uniref:N-acetyltransferase domain-containing protein n=1 Tax=Bimuria novae-zelandiae CBS 107.79 TaxID=1447943 RepID=A0A6A5VLJ5_9PLEO|nr:hypothetical protein BU23DRAFT_598366 [Bimuria novae-zelandiae CBS 107.79]
MEHGSVIPILLLPRHISSTPQRRPLLEQIKSVLNASYRITHGSRPDIFDTVYTRFPDAIQLTDIIGKDGFTVALVRSESTDERHGKCWKILATGSVKRWKEGKVETYEQWGEKMWPESEEQLGDVKFRDESNEEALNKAAVHVAEDRGVTKYELTGFAVSPTAQGAGLGVRVLEEIEWLVSYWHKDSFLQLLLENESTVKKIQFEHGSESGGLEGFSVRKIRDMTLLDGDWDFNAGSRPQLVLLCIRELGTEAYYQRRGFKTKWSGPVPVGVWDNKKECTVAYMERDRQQGIVYMN